MFIGLVINYQDKQGKFFSNIFWFGVQTHITPEADILIAAYNLQLRLL